jgi:hypothetical protein
MNPIDDPQIRTIATRKIAEAVDALSQALNEERAQKKRELAMQGMGQGGALVMTMHDLNIRSLEGRVFAQYQAWKDALTETSHALTAAQLRGFADDAARTLDGADARLATSLRQQCVGMEVLAEKMEPQIKRDVQAIRARFIQKSEIEIAKATVIERKQSMPSDLDNELVGEVVARFLKNEIILVHRFQTEHSSKRQHLEKNIREGLLERFNDRYYPTYGSFALGSVELRAEADRCVASILKALKQLYRDNGMRYYTADEIRKATDLDLESLRIGLQLAAGFQSYLHPRRTGEGGVESLCPQETIVNFVAPAEAWTREREVTSFNDQVRQRIFGGVFMAPTNVESFPFMKNVELRRIVERDYAELQRLQPEIAAKSVLILAGSIIEGVLLDAVMRAAVVMEGKAVEMTLAQLLQTAVRDRLITEDRLGNAVRNYRNLIHPWREVRDEIQFSKADAILARAAVDVVIQELRRNFEAFPSTTPGANEF